MEIDFDLENMGLDFPKYGFSAKYRSFSQQDCWVKSSKLLDHLVSKVMVTWGFAHRKSII